MQCAGGLEDGATRCAQLLNMLYDLPTEEQDPELGPEDPATLINTDIKAAFQEMCRQTSFDTLTGKATKSYAMMTGRCSLATKSQPLKSCGLSWDTSRPCAAPSAPIATLITAGTLIPLKAQPEVSMGIPGR